MKGFAITKDRILKAKKIEKILSDYLGNGVSNLKILDIGAGNGDISSYFVKNSNTVFCVDITDQRSIKKAEFVMVTSAKLPFKSNEFDIVISNHVIEHIKDQDTHLEEIKRVLRKNGICYIATPNRNFPIEPHYRIPLIHYLPLSIFDWILKITKQYKESLYLLSYNNMLIKYNGFIMKEYTIEVVKNPKEFFMSSKLISQLPYKLLFYIKHFAPTNIFILKKNTN